MRALTVRQPWAWAIVHGGKDVENRTQAWGYRGPVAIHAAIAEDTASLGHPLIRAAMGAVDTSVATGSGRALWHRGLIIGVVDLVGVHHHAGSGDRNDCCHSPWAETWSPGAGRLVHLELANPRALAEPLPCRGRLGLWTPPPDVLSRLEAPS